MAIIKKPFRKAFYLGTLIMGIILPLAGKVIIGNRQDLSRQSDNAKNFFSSPETFVGIPMAQADVPGGGGDSSAAGDGSAGDSSGAGDGSAAGDCSAGDASACDGGGGAF